jgi:hypothetical protein
MSLFSTTSKREGRPVETIRAGNATDEQLQRRAGVIARTRYGRYWARTSDLRLVEAALSQLS